MTRRLFISYESDGRCAGSPPTGEPCIELFMADFHGPRHIHAWAGLRIPVVNVDRGAMTAALEVLHHKTDTYAT